MLHLLPIIEVQPSHAPICPLCVYCLLGGVGLARHFKGLPYRSLCPASHNRAQDAAPLARAYASARKAVRDEGIRGPPERTPAFESRGRTPSAQATGSVGSKTSEASEKLAEGTWHKWITTTR